jgi:serine/threonine protein kinase
MSTTGNRIIDGRYEVVEESAKSGGMSQIYLVRDLAYENKPTRVMKVCIFDLDDEDGRERFRREVRMMQAINSPLVASILDAHLRGEEGIVIADLGLSVEPSSTTRRTQLSLIGAGTEAYAPPEFFEPGGFANATAASDIYSIGKTMFELCTGKNPRFPASNDMPRPLWFVLKKCWENNPLDRHQSVGELREALSLAFDLFLSRNKNPLTRSQELVESIQQPDGPNIEPSIKELVPLLLSLNDEDFRSLSEKMDSHFIKRFLHHSDVAGVDALLSGYGTAFRVGNYPSL